MKKKEKLQEEQKTGKIQGLLWGSDLDYVEFL